MGKALGVTEVLVEKVPMEIVHVAVSLEEKRQEEEILYQLCRGKLNKADSDEYDHYVRGIHGS